MDSMEMNNMLKVSCVPVIFVCTQFPKRVYPFSSTQATCYNPSFLKQNSFGIPESKAVLHWKNTGNKNMPLSHPYTLDMFESKGCDQLENKIYVYSDLILRSVAIYFIINLFHLFQELLCVTSDPCQKNGTCIEDPVAPTCDCLNGYTGEFCETGTVTKEVINTKIENKRYFYCTTIFHHLLACTVKIKLQTS